MSCTTVIYKQLGDSVLPPVSESDFAIDINHASLPGTSFCESKSKYALPETKIAFKNWSSKKGVHLPTIDCQGLCQFRGDYTWLFAYHFCSVDEMQRQSCRNINDGRYSIMHEIELTSTIKSQKDRPSQRNGVSSIVLPYWIKKKNNMMLGPG